MMPQHLSLPKSNILTACSALIFGRSGLSMAVGLWRGRTQITRFSVAPGGLSQQPGCRADRRIRRVLPCWRRGGWASVRGLLHGIAAAPAGHRGRAGRWLMLPRGACCPAPRPALPAPGLTARRRPGCRRPARLSGPRPLRPRPGPGRPSPLLPGARRPARCSRWPAWPRGPAARARPGLRPRPARQPAGRARHQGPHAPADPGGGLGIRRRELSLVQRLRLLPAGDVGETLSA
jgi:hypothetical protein